MSTLLYEPAEAIAAGRCLAARTPGRVEGRPMPPSHPRACGWCDWPLEDLRRMVDGFNEWAGYSARSNTFGHHELRVWAELPRDEQERRIEAAQAFTAADEPVAAAEAPEAHERDVDEEGPAWLRP